jgi:hypothetical protein
VNLIRLAAGFYKHTNEPLGSIKRGTFLDHLRDYDLFKDSTHGFTCYLFKFDNQRTLRYKIFVVALLTPNLSTRVQNPATTPYPGSFHFRIAQSPILILCSNLPLGFPNCLLPRLPTEMFDEFILSHMRATCLSHSIFLDFFTVTILIAVYELCNLLLCTCTGLNNNISNLL